MIKRTVEIVLSWIGNILHLLYLGFIALMVSMMGNKDFKHEMIHNTQDSNQGVSSDQLNQSYGMLSSMGTWYIIGFIVLLILAIIATLLISKKSKIAGIILLIVGVIALLTSSFLAGILWIIAGIMLLARKPKNDPNHQYNDNHNAYANNEHHRNNNHNEYDRNNNYNNNHNEYDRNHSHDDNHHNHDHHNAHDNTHSHDNYQNNEHYENGNRQVNEKNNSFILSGDDKKQEQQEIKDQYSHNSDRESRDLNNHSKDNHHDFNSNDTKRDDFIKEEERHRKNEKEDNPFKY